MNVFKTLTTGALYVADYFWYLLLNYRSISSMFSDLLVNTHLARGASRLLHWRCANLPTLSLSGGRLGGGLHSPLLWFEFAL